MGRAIGIDLGTTNSVAAVVDGPKARVLDSKEGKPEVRSAVSLKKRKGKKAEGKSELLVGDASRAQAELGWSYDTTFEDLVREMVDADLDLLQRNPSTRDGRRG